MTQRERSILIAVGAIVLALGGLLIALQSFGGGDASSADGGQFIENGSAGAPSDDTPLDDQGNLLATGAGGTATGGLNPAEPTTSLAGAAPATSSSSSTSSSTTAAPTTSAPAPTTTEAPSIPTVANSQATTTTAAPATTGSTAPTSSSSATVPPTAAPSSTTVATTAAPTTAPPTTAAPGRSSTAPPTPAPPPTDPPSSGLHAVEREIFRLTNQLRANPSGPLARVKPMPDCVNEDFYGITISGSTGHPEPVPALTLNETVSIELARDWSIEMDRTDNFEHRSNASASAIYDQLGIRWQATGENIAWFRGYPDSEAATIFFEGWRESDTGHYCALISGTYTHIGVGYYKGSTSSWATQNFYRPR